MTDSSSLCYSLTESEQGRIVHAAARLARRLHAGQVDKAGVDYFTGHLTTVASMGSTWEERVVGYLHDAAEDTPHTVDEVLRLLAEEAGTPLPEECVARLTEALRLLDHHASPDRESYITAVGTSPLATRVKLHDLTHNMDLSRLPSPTQKDLDRLERYRRECDLLNSLY